MRQRGKLFGVVFAVALAFFAAPAWATDTDSDGLTDAFETAFGTATNDADSDDDSLIDFDEIFVHGTNPNLADTDGDGDDDDIDPEPLQYNGATDGGTTATGGPLLTTPLYAWSGESAVEGAGVYVHSGMFEYTTSAGFFRQVNGPWQFWLRYSSHDTRDGPTGVGWSSILDLRVSEVGDDVDMLMPDGVERRWVWSSGGGVFNPPDEVLGDLTEDSGVYTWKLPSGQELQFTMAVAGQLTSMTDRYGNGITVSHDVNDLPETITDARGEVHELAWYGTNRLSHIEYADGRIWQFQYDDEGNLLRIIGPPAVGFPAGITEEFRYIRGSGVSALNHNMVQAIDGNGNARLQMQYDTADRVTVQTVGAHDFEFDYTNAGSYETTVFDRSGNERVWTWDPSTLCKVLLEQKSNRDVRAGDPASWDTAWTHDGDGYLTSVTLPRGNGVKYTLNAVKRVTERRHKTVMSAGDNDTNDIVHTWTYENAAKFYAVATYTDPKGHVTTYTNNSDGRPTNIAFETVTHLDPDQDVEHDYTYNADGTVDTFTDGAGHVTAYSYYATGLRKGLLETVNVADGDLDLDTTYDYNDFGEVVSVTDPSGNETTHTVNAYGRVTKTESPSALGYETTFTYDGNLNVTHHRVKRVDENGSPLTGPTHQCRQAPEAALSVG